MVIDWIFLLLLVLFLFRGYRKGLLIALFSVIALIAGLVGAIKLSKVVGTLLFGKSPAAANWAPVLTYIGVFFIIAWLIRIFARFLEKSLELVALGWINRLCGALLYGCLLSLAFSGFLWILNRMQVVPDAMLSQSRLFPILEPLAPRLVALMGEFIPWVKDAFQELNQFFDQVNQKTSGYVGAH